MSELKLTNEKMKTFNGEKKSVFGVSGQLQEFGNSQNAANELLAANVNELIKRVCALEDEQVKNREIMKSLASELAACKKELKYFGMLEKQNSAAIARLSGAPLLNQDAEGQDSEGKASENKGNTSNIEPYT